LLEQVRADAGAPPVADEKAYVRLREAQAPRLEAAAALGPPSGGAIADNKAYAVTRKAFDDADKLYRGASSDLADRSAPDRFTKALAALKVVAAEAAKLLQAHADKLASDVDGVLKKAGGRPATEQADAEVGAGARTLAQAANPMVLRSLKGEQLAKLLKAIRKAPDVEPTGGPFLQTRLYVNSALDEEFLKEEKKHRHAVIESLIADREALKTARDQWPTLKDADRLAVFEKIADKHCKAMGFDAPAKVSLIEDKPATSGGFQRAEKIININKKGDTFNDFELMMDSIFHENSHNWQLQLVERIRGQRPPPIEKSDPLYQQALLFDANQGDNDEGYDNGAGYKAQPKEAHAHHAGPKMSRALMRALSKS
jgi:hypothetical protein